MPLSSPDFYVILFLMNSFDANRQHLSAESGTKG